VTPEQPEYRLSDAEREEAIEALGEHLSSGRLDIDEYGDRTAQVTAAKTRRELAPIFDDLPDPHPSVLVARLPAVSQGMTLAPIPQKDLAERLAPLIVPAAAVLALVLFFVTRQWLVFLLPVIAAVLAGMAMKRGYE
jgi:hypothetical protein